MVGKFCSTIYNQETIKVFNPGGAEELVFPFLNIAAGSVQVLLLLKVIKGIVSTVGMLS